MVALAIYNTKVVLGCSTPQEIGILHLLCAGHRGIVVWPLLLYEPLISREVFNSFVFFTKMSLFRHGLYDGACSTRPPLVLFVSLWVLIALPSFPFPVRWGLPHQIGALLDLWGLGRHFLDTHATTLTIQLFCVDNMMFQLSYVKH